MDEVEVSRQRTRWYQELLTLVDLLQRDDRWEGILRRLTVTVPTRRSPDHRADPARDPGATP